MKKEMKKITEFNFDMNQRGMNKVLIKFAEELKKISEMIGFKISSRGWCYQLEKYGLTKDNFDKAQNWINRCRRRGFLPIDFTAEEEGRRFSGVEIPNRETPVQNKKSWIEGAMNSGKYYTPDWWKGEEYYIQMLVEKIDLKTLFSPICEKYHIPIATCFDSKTEILTKGGWRKFTEITKKDWIVTMDKKEKLIHQNPIRVINEYYSGKMYQIKNRGTDQLITPNHKVYVQRQRNNPKNLRFELVSIREVAHLQNLKFKKNINWIGQEKRWFKLPIIKGVNNIIKEQLDMNLWLQFLGYYLSEGSLNHKPRNNIYVIQLAQKKEKHPKIYQKMKECVKKLGYNFYENYQAIQISNKQIYTYLKQFGKSYEKYIPREYLKLSQRQLKILLDALIEGDGHKRKNRAVYITSSKQLANDVQELALRSGYYASISLKPKSGGIIRGRKIKCKHQCYCVNICKARDTFRINHGKKDYQIVDYKGSIHCVEIPSGIIYTRRNGKPVWSGNSKGWSSIIQRGLYAKRFLRAEQKKLKCVLLYCGDFDPDGLRISEFIRKNLDDIKNITWDNGEDGYDPKNLIIDRFGLNFDFIEKHKLSWINNLITGTKLPHLKGIGLDNPIHPNHNMPYVQAYLKKYGARKVEANAIIPKPVIARQLVQGAIVNYLGNSALSRFEKKMDEVKAILNDFEERTGLNEALQKALDLIEEGEDEE